MNGHLYKPENHDRFELENTFEKLDLNCDLLFIKDTSPHLFYLEEFHELQALIISMTAEYSFVVCTGFSAGGWASMLYGSLAEVHCVVAINPMTSLIDAESGQNLVILHNANTAQAFLNGHVSSDLLDVKPFMNSKTLYFLNGSKHNGLYKDLTLVEKIHDYHNYERVSSYANVSWLDFSIQGYKDGQFLDLLRSVSVPID